MDSSGNIFEQSSNSQENEILPKNSYEFVCDTLPESSQTSSQNDILKALMEVLNGQKESNARLAKLEENQTIIIQNQSILSQGMASIVSNQEQIAKELERINVNIEKNPEAMAQTKVLRECKVGIKKIEKSVCHMTGELQDKLMDEVTSMFPLETTTGVLDIEQRLQVPEFAQAMTMYLHRAKGTSEDVSSIIRSIFTDALLDKYNWEGTWEKQALCQLTFVNNTLRDVFSAQGSFQFEKTLRKAVVRAHHRLQQKKYFRKAKTAATAATKTTATSISTSTSILTSTSTSS